MVSDSVPLPDGLSQTLDSMIDQWIKKLSDALAPDSTDASGRGSADAASINAIERVSATLLIEIARADHEIDAVELAAIRQALQQSSATLSEQDVDEITELALKDADLSVSLHDQVRVINETCSRSQKIQLVEYMWQVAMADGNLDKYEEYSIRKLCDLLHVRHREYMQAKLRVLDKD